MNNPTGRWGVIAADRDQVSPLQSRYAGNVAASGDSRAASRSASFTSLGRALVAAVAIRAFVGVTCTCTITAVAGRRGVSEEAVGPRSG